MDSSQKATYTFVTIADLAAGTSPVGVELYPKRAGSENGRIRSWKRGLFHIFVQNLLYSSGFKLKQLEKCKIMISPAPVDRYQKLAGKKTHRFFY